MVEVRRLYRSYFEPELVVRVVSEMDGYVRARIVSPGQTFETTLIYKTHVFNLGYELHVKG